MFIVSIDILITVHVNLNVKIYFCFQQVIDAMTVGTVLHISNITAVDTEREVIKKYFSDYAPVAWIDYNTGDTEVRQIL